MIKMMPFFHNGPLGPWKMPKEYATEDKPTGKPSTSLESEPDSVSFEPAGKETCSKDPMKMKSNRRESAPQLSPAPLREANGSCAGTPEQRESPQKRGVKGKLKEFFNISGGIRKTDPKEKDTKKKEDMKKKEDKPLTAEQIVELIEDDKLFDAAQYLIALERGFHTDCSGKSEEELTRDRDEVEKAYELLKQKVFSIIRDSIIIVKKRPELLQHAVKALIEQENEDEKYKSEKPFDKILSSRPRKWKELWMDTVKKSTDERMKEIKGTTENLSTTALNFLHMGKTMKKDLTIVVQHIKQLYPLQFNVCSAYAECYHDYFASQVEMIAEFELEDKDVYLILSWVQNLYPNDIIKNPILKNDLEGAKLGSLLPAKQIKQLEAKYLCNEVANVKNWLGKTLELEIRRWTEEKEPEKPEKYFHNELDFHVLQTIHGGQKRAEEITPDLGKQASTILLVELSTFLKSYKKALEEFKEKNRQHRYFKETIIANVNNCASFRTHAEKTVSTPDDTKASILATLNEIENSAYNVLLQDLFLELKPLFKKFTQNKWACTESIMEEILKTTSSSLSEFHTLRDPFYKGIMEKIHIHLVREYIVRLMKKRVTLKTPELQQNLAKCITNDASLLQTFCTKNGSEATWLDSVLPKLAEIIRLQDSSAMKIEVAMLAKTYPDISKKHLAAILYIKGNLTNSEIKSVQSYLDQSGAPTTSRTPLFSAIKVS
ncbi:tumor necrosis factor alpha-induced protein 2 isoform X1 [Alligator mississippiensis]|uniref:tumor necrosis factor alpha-induced protein 2 isoform X1 n=1 Tax=Alligator mississippiensis TaxID=8496 RepID=UPI000711F644|nr:tumor necrosis factor alpha-induced protein 2 isoform X1 [Alligator mississippiensis]